MHMNIMNGLWSIAKCIKWKALKKTVENNADWIGHGALYKQNEDMLGTQAKQFNAQNAIYRIRCI